MGVRERLTGEAIHSQYGEDAMILELLALVPDAPKVCCEIGAGDGLHISNTAALWRDHGWLAVLCEADTDHTNALLRNTEGFKVETIVGFGGATPENVNGIVPPNCSVLSIDIDGDDYYLLEALTIQPKILCVEYNPTIPHWIDVVGERGACYGASVAAFVRLCRSKGLVLAGATHCNLIFTFFDHPYETDPEIIVGRDSLCYLSTDYNGHPYPIGPLSFGLASPGHDHTYP